MLHPHPSGTSNDVLSSLLALISSVTSSDGAGLEASLEDGMPDLVYGHLQLRGPLRALMSAESVCCRALGLTYLAAALATAASPDAEAAALVTAVVEQHLLRAEAYAELRGRTRALRRLAHVLHMYASHCANSYRRTLHFLRVAASVLVPAPSCLSVAHSLLLREARRARCPAPALALMRRSVLRVCPAETGAGAASCRAYYARGGLLLADLRCWADAAVWLRAALSLARRPTRPDRSERESESELEGDKEKDAELLLAATKALLLVTAIAHGRAADAGDRRRVQQLLQQTRGAEPYLRLAAAAAQRDGALWTQHARHYEAVWQQDQTAALVAVAGERLRQHIVRDVAAVACRVPIEDVAAALCAHRVCDEAQGPVVAEALLLAMHETGELRSALARGAVTLGRPGSGRGLFAPLGCCRRGLFGAPLCLAPCEGQKAAVAEAFRRAVAERIARMEAAREALLEMAAGEKEMLRKGEEEEEKE